MVMGEAKRALDRHLSQQEAYEREDRLHKRAQRAEGDLLKANAVIADLRAQLQAEMEHADRLAAAINTGSEITESQDEMLRAHAEWRKK